MDYRALTEGVWRPMVIETTEHLWGAPDNPGPAIVTRLSVTRAGLEPLEAPLPSLIDDEQQLWQVWQD